MFKRIIGIGDVHGMFQLLASLIWNQIMFNPAEDMLVFLGDYIDRGPQSKQVVEFVASLKERYPDSVVLLKGNHEELAENAFRNPDTTADVSLWLHNGAASTIKSFGDLREAEKVLMPFIEKLEMYKEIEGYTFVHANFPSPEITDTESREQCMLWSRDFSKPFPDGRTLVVGHTVQNEVFFENGYTFVDTGAYKTNRLSAYDVLNDKVYEDKVIINSPGAYTMRNGRLAYIGEIKGNGATFNCAGVYKRGTKKVAKEELQSTTWAPDGFHRAVGQHPLDIIAKQTAATPAV